MEHWDGNAREGLEPMFAGLAAAVSGVICAMLFGAIGLGYF